MKREEVCALIKEIGILPSVRVASQDLAFFAAETVYAAGIPIVEITLTVPGALEVVKDLAKRFPKLAVGAGTVLDEDLAKRSVDAGAKISDHPGFVPEVVTYARKADVAVLSGSSYTNGNHCCLESRFGFREDLPHRPCGWNSICAGTQGAASAIPLIATGGVKPGECDRLHPRPERRPLALAERCCRRRLCTSPRGSYP